MSPLEYEYWTWDKELPKNAETATVKMATPSQLTGLSEAQAKIHFWQITQAELVPYIQKHILIDGWQPISEIGPAALKITSYNQTGGFGRLLSQYSWPRCQDHKVTKIRWNEKQQQRCLSKV